MGNLEYYAMLKLFGDNATQLHSKYQNKNEEDKSVLLVASFVLPLCPIGMRDLGILTKDPGCEVCGNAGKENIKRCAGCLAVSYCSKGKS